MQINQSKLNAVQYEIKHRRDMLINFAYDENIQMDQYDKQCIIAHLEHGEIPRRPKDIPSLMKTFFTSCFSYAPLRKYLTPIVGSIPEPRKLPRCLSEVYAAEEFLADQNWLPNKLNGIASKIQQKENFDLKSKQFKPRMMSVILDGSHEMEKRLKYGIEQFYHGLDEINNGPAEEMWEYLSGFSKPIHNVGPTLISDFLKNIGCDRFVKVDHHFKREFPHLLGLDDCKKHNSKENFILSQEISNLLEISPFYLDHLLYQWGRYKRIFI